MATNAETKSLAVLIDADNTSAKHAQAIFDEIVKLGEANVRRIYGDFSGGHLSGWDGAIQSLAILQHQQRSNSRGKNASDIALVIDAMDLMHKNTLDGIVLCQLGQRLHAPRAAAAGGGPGRVRLRRAKGRSRRSATHAAGSSTWRTSWRPSRTRATGRRPGRRHRRRMRRARRGRS